MLTHRSRTSLGAGPSPGHLSVCLDCLLAHWPWLPFLQAVVEMGRWGWSGDEGPGESAGSGWKGAAPQAPGSASFLEAPSKLRRTPPPLILTPNCLSNEETFLTQPVKSPGPSPHYCQAQN